MDLIVDVLKVLFRVGTILPIMLLVTLFMGKRSIGELPVFDFLVILTLGSVVGADIAEPSVNHLPTVAAVIAIALLQKLIAWWKIKNHRVGRFLSFEPTMVMYDGQFHLQNMKKISYSIDNILQMLREKGIFRAEDVHFALVEANGELSVQLKPGKDTVKLEDFKLPPTKTALEIAVIIDGRIQKEALTFLKLSEAWLKEELLRQDIIHEKDVFYAGVNENNQLHVSLRTQATEVTLPIFH
ncbi:hypothetical protein FIU87_06555 [Bacillus sp. THAF10]|uniref:DUF421 domain-containing protein n=1 Tax=Bacillus sp. THAF10 TaxID=2587848 RepID=UPI001268BDF7|nr:DUF421 domain-containing protein [Bacillus sp. THAF10]QFT88297.1 hypothetical protein FIU87_06555 [Bacillus sp. THAF10]